MVFCYSGNVPFCLSLTGRGVCRKVIAYSGDLRMLLRTFWVNCMVLNLWTGVKTIGSFYILSVGIGKKLELRPELKPDERINGLFFSNIMFFSSMHLADITFLLGTLNCQGPCSFNFPSNPVSPVSDQLIDLEITACSSQCWGLGFFGVTLTSSLGGTFHFFSRITMIHSA